MSITLRGVAGAGGIAIGHVHLVSETTVDVVHLVLPDADIPAEVQRFDAAIKETRKQLEMLWGSIPDNAPAELGSFLSLHIMLLNDPALSRDPRGLIEEQRCNAEWALKQQLEVLLAQFDEIEEDYLRERRADVIQVADRILKVLAGHVACHTHAQLATDEETILVAHDLSPADMVQYKDIEFAAFVTDAGGATSHTAILARSLGIPSVVAMHNARELLKEGELVIVDGTQGIVIAEPDEEELAYYRHLAAAWNQNKISLTKIRTEAAVTLDSQQVELMGNIELPQDVDEVFENGAKSVGLFRSEFLFLSRDDLPSEDEQFEAYKAVASALNGESVTIRTLDIGTDKIPRWFERGSGINPALGLCGVRLTLAQPHIFQTQLRALLRASAFGNIQIMFPLLSESRQIRQCVQHVELAKQTLREEGLPFNENIKIGGMVEIPAAAINVAGFLKDLSFVSIGTNDLVQYTLGVDRGDDQVAHLYNPAHPAVLHLLSHVIGTANRLGKEVSVCGEMAGDPRFTRLLLGMGLRKFSMHPASLLAVKQVVRTTDTALLGEKVSEIITQDDEDLVAPLLDALNV
ncbi:phosphoenolpyruvate--protein phosphotransferase [Leeia sp. TBRC 13508]|uniref:Phosphoenolpyruvate-protein phosphotransferase n=1 Tax=Leeia speluncae TaxID=2884804 RepID=A0ABS8D5I3_9NEIS|nr:phosphoenolpyruvate--protein phosphotransferase [Leeia speluncae]MCB6183387.1 phosphoenolpyruvate--protein phosphotransferase [Leeia speluncae]